jgi:predicted nucleic-acid-binding Zn-ribbon protein
LSLPVEGMNGVISLNCDIKCRTSELVATNIEVTGNAIRNMENIEKMKPSEVSN